jgi:hypothetical protein
MNKSVSIALLVVGLILICFGIDASNSLGSGVSRLFTGAPTDRTIWLYAGGAAAAVAGFIGLTRGK